MNDFIQMAVSQLGVSESAAKSATGGLLGLLQKHSDSGQFSSLMNQIPGASDMLKGGGGGGGIGGALSGILGGKGGGGGGGLGNIASMASGLLGKDSGAGQLAGVMSMLGGSGLPTDKAGPFVKLFMNYISGKGGGNVVQGLLGKMPELKGLIG